MCVFILRPFLFPYWMDGMRTISLDYEIDRGDFTDWMPFIPTSLKKQISPNPEILSTNT